MPISLKPNLLKYRNAQGEDETVVALRGEPGAGLQIDKNLQAGSHNPVENAAIYNAINKIETIEKDIDVFSDANILSGYYLSDTGALTGSNVFITTDYIDVADAKKLFVEGTCNASPAVTYRRVHVYDANKTWLGQAAKYEIGINVNGPYEFECELGENTAFVRYSYRETDKDIKFIKGLPVETSISEMANQLSYIVNDVLDNMPNVNGGGDIIQDPADKNGGVVVGGTLADIDKSLTLDNYAADAKVVGEKLSAITGAIATLNNDSETPVEAGKVWTTTAYGAGWANAQEALGIEGWHTATATESDFVVENSYAQYKIVPPDGMRVAEVNFLFQISRDEAGTANANVNIGMHDTPSDSGYHSLAVNVATASLYFAAGGTLKCLNDYATVFVGTQGANSAAQQLPSQTAPSTQANKTLYVSTRPSRTVSFNVNNNFKLDRAYLVANYRLERAD